MDFLNGAIGFLVAAKYPLIFLGSFTEGTVVMLGTGILWHAGQVSFWPAYGALLLGDFLSDLMWYFVGRYGARTFMDKWGHLIGATPEVIERIQDRFHRYHTQILLVSKLSMGFGFSVATLTTAGMMHIPLSRYILINGLGGFVWVFGVLCVGYYFGNVLALIPREFQIAAGILGLVVAFFGLRYASKQLARREW